MRKVLEHLGRDGDSYVCVECGHILEGFPEGAARFDERLQDSQPASAGEGHAGFVLRHLCCPSCGVLFDVQPVPLAATEPAA